MPFLVSIPSRSVSIDVERRRCRVNVPVVAAQPTVEVERWLIAAKAEQVIEGLFDLPRVPAAGTQDGFNEGRVLTCRPSIDGVDFVGKLRDDGAYLC